MKTSPLPTKIPTFVVALPLPTAPHRELAPISEFSCEFIRVVERSYTAKGQPMYAAEYAAATVFGAIRGGVVVNGNSGNIPQAVALVALAVAKTMAILFAYLNQSPPLALPPNEGLPSPLSRETTVTQDGTARFRGFCAGLASVDPDLVSTVDVYVPPVFWVPSVPS